MRKVKLNLLRTIQLFDVKIISFFSSIYRLKPFVNTNIINDSSISN